MKHGKSKFLNQEKVYNLLKANGEVVQYSAEIQWIIIYENTLQELILGITNIGEYVFIDAGKTYLLNEKKMFLYCVKLLEIPYTTIQEHITLRFKKVLLEADVGEMEIFPYYEIVEFALDNLFNDYWVELVWRWYDHFSQYRKYELYDSLDKLSKMKKISQQNRNIAKREIKRLNQYRQFLVK